MSLAATYMPCSSTLLLSAAENFNTADCISPLDDSRQYMHVLFLQMESDLSSNIIDNRYMEIGMLNIEAYPTLNYFRREPIIDTNRGTRCPEIG